MACRDEAKHEPNPGRIVDASFEPHEQDEISGPLRRNGQIARQYRKGKDDQEAAPADALQEVGPCQVIEPSHGVHCPLSPPLNPTCPVDPLADETKYR